MHRRRDATADELREWGSEAGGAVAGEVGEEERGGG